MPPFHDGYYWARHRDGTRFIVFREDGHWYCCGVHNSIDEDFDTSQNVSLAKPPEN